MLRDWIGGDGARYHDFVWDAVIKANVFQNFRRHRHYRAILEHVSKEQGTQYLKFITNPLVREICFASEHADTIGNPEVGSYEGAKLSPTTLRYAKVLSDLISLFPAFMNYHSFIEIGVGYGGQARLISEFAEKVNSEILTYTLVDLLPVIHLARLYLEHFALKPSLVYKTKSTLTRSDRWDLAISNYAFSEFSRKLQEEYLETVFKNASSGYLTMNTGLSNGQGWGGTTCFTARELLKSLPNAVLRCEEPMTGANNYIIVYGDHNIQSNM